MGQGRYFPDNYRYVWTCKAIDAAAADPEFFKNIYDHTRSEKSTDSQELTAWLNSDIERIHYLSRALDETYGYNDAKDLLAPAQWAEIEDVFFRVHQCLVQLSRSVENATIEYNKELLQGEDIGQ